MRQVGIANSIVIYIRACVIAPVVAFTIAVVPGVCRSKIIDLSCVINDIIVEYLIIIGIYKGEATHVIRNRIASN